MPLFQTCAGGFADVYDDSIVTSEWVKPTPMYTAHQMSAQMGGRHRANLALVGTHSIHRPHFVTQMYGREGMAGGAMMGGGYLDTLRQLFSNGLGALSRVAPYIPGAVSTAENLASAWRNQPGSHGPAKRPAIADQSGMMPAAPTAGIRRRYGGGGGY